MTSLPAKLSRLISRADVKEWHNVVEIWHYKYPPPHSATKVTFGHPGTIEVIDAAYVDKLERILAAVGPLVEALEIAATIAWNKDCEGTFEPTCSDAGRCEPCREYILMYTALTTFTEAVTREVGE